MLKDIPSVETIFAAALEIEPGERRRAYLAEACGEDAERRKRVEKLLEADAEAGSFLVSPVAAPEPTLAAPAVTEGPGTVIGRYKLLAQLGAGGFGVVFMAEQREPYRRVALKIIKPGMDTKEVIARFAAEEQALALMEHPNIARVFDAGATASGRPYFVMELVKGVPITDYCDQNSLTPEERLQLFTDVCRAIQHAHQKGIIHRDIKPSNILVTMQDGAPIVKVIDFGIAKAVSQRLTDQTLFTYRGAILGTPLYMSPEQAGLRGLDVDTRTDIYSLGVVLYELLTGATPFDRQRLSGATPEEVCRIIREEEPPRPSTKIHTLGDTASTVAEHRKTEPRKLLWLVKGDLDWIVMKAMEKDRTRRYETVKDFAEDVKRYLDHKPVSASPPSIAYTARKFLRRNRTSVLVTTAITAALLLLLITGRYIAVATAARWAAQHTADRLTQLDASIIPEAERMKNEERYVEAAELVRPWRRDFPEHTRLAEVWHAITCNWTVMANETGARVCRKPYAVAGAKWEDLGLTPLDRVAVARGFFHWKIEKDGFVTVEGCAGPQDVEVRRELLHEGQTPPGMVQVVVPTSDGRKVSFFIDRFEVTNREFKTFVAAGGYRRPEFWRVPILKDGKTLTSNEAWTLFVDTTNAPGPATWANGTYPTGEDELPVRGVSWYEAAAYAEFRGKSLPTTEQWSAAASVELVAYVAPRSNMNSEKPAPVGSHEAPSAFGVFDVAGNAKEWCLNSTTRGRRVVCGGSWEDPVYMFDMNEFVDPIDRWPSLGFRCAEELVASSKEPTLVNEGSGVIEVPPAPSPEQLAQYKSAFRYDKRAKFNETISIDSASGPHCIHEIVELDAAYANERLTVHLLLPKDRQGPYQTIVYFPGAGAQRVEAFSLEFSDATHALAMVAAGRAVCFPVYKGTFERRALSPSQGPEQQSELRLAQVKDLCRAMDYLETRPDTFDMTSPVYVGLSWGAALAPLMMGVEDRFNACVLIIGGLWRGSFYPELDPKTYVRLLEKPVLMINGARDWKHFPLTESQRPLFNAISSQDKRHHVFPEAGHGSPFAETQALIDSWLTEHFGPVGSPLSPAERADQLAEKAQILLARKRYSHAEPLLTQAMKTYEEDPGQDDPKTLRTATRLAEAILNQGRGEEVRQTLEDTHRRQSATLGDAHKDTLETCKVLATAYTSFSIRTSWEAGRSLRDYQEAVDLAQRSIRLFDLHANQHTALALALYRCGDWLGAAKGLQDAVSKESRVNAWLLNAMVHKRLGHDELASCWYAAATEWMNKERVTSGGPVQMAAEAASVLKLPTPWPPSDWAETDWVQAYDRLIQEEPGLSRLYHCRGSHYGVLGEWKKAAADYAKAAELAPMNVYHTEAHAAVCLVLDDTKTYDAICRAEFARFEASELPNVRTTWVIMSALGPTGPVDPATLNRVSEGVVSGSTLPQQHPYHNLGRGMALYRSAGWEQTLETLPTSGFLNPKDEILAILFRAMAHTKLGDSYTSRKLLDKAREEIQTQVLPLDGPELPYQDRPVVWCMVQTALREAEALIEGGASSAVKTASAAAGP